eukprot:gnl/TRDRNA2_/TRDRNA2_189392_c0_seq1.p1 gnl/TRDRNA2_/TRDRNA2_189392_c0~~gnl/TRDRNA2_/TRDRNA2_189392_c0_seq1.p1  ORF type:complete len:569 (+),score=92.36 gnl/TRDRNA2_/TRDRNA2_189392_c0_seq1:73-1779(+)
MPEPPARIQVDREPKQHCSDSNSQLQSSGHADACSGTATQCDGSAAKNGIVAATPSTACTTPEVDERTPAQIDWTLQPPLSVAACADAPVPPPTLPAEGVHGLLARCNLRTGSAVAAAACATMAIALGAAHISIGWLAVATVSLALLAQNKVRLPVKARLSTLVCLAAGAGFMALYCFIALCVVPSADAGSELVGAIVLGSGLLWHARMIWRRPNDPPPPQRCCCRCLGCTATLLATILAFSAVVDAVWGMHALAAYGPQNFAYTEDGVRLNYYCEGAVRSDAIIVLEAGWMEPSPALYWIVKGLAVSTTRTCTLDVSGTGWSSLPESYGFQDDAHNMKAVLDAEFEAAGLSGAAQRRVVVVGGHSRGAVTADTFKWIYENEYSGIVGFEFDGSICNGLYVGPAQTALGMPEGVLVFLASFMGLFSGLLRLVLVPSNLRGIIISGGDAADSGDEHMADIENEWEFVERLVGLSGGSFFRQGAYRSNAWISGSYDGPESCEFSSDEWLYISSNTICYGRGSNEECAEHVSLLVQSNFAKVAVSEVARFLETAIPLAGLASNTTATRASR